MSPLIFAEVPKKVLRRIPRSVRTALPAFGVALVTALAGSLIYFYTTFGRVYPDYACEIAIGAAGSLLVSSFLVSKFCKLSERFPPLALAYAERYLLWTIVFLGAVAILRLTPYWLFFIGIATIHRTPGVFFAMIFFIVAFGIFLLYLLIRSTKKVMLVSFRKAVGVTLVCAVLGTAVVGTPVLLLTHPSVIEWIGVDQDILFSLVGAEFGHLVLDFRKNWSTAHDIEFRGPMGASFPSFEYKRADPSLTYVINVRGLDPDLKITLQTLQGNVNKHGPMVYLIFRDFDDNIWLDTIPGEKEPIDWENAFQTFRENLKGKVIFRRGSIHERCVAVTIAGLENAIAVPDDFDLDGLVDPDLPLLENLVGRGEDPVGLYGWAIEEFWPRCNKCILGIQPLHHSEVAFVDFVVRSEAFMSSLNFAKSSLYFYHESAEAALFERLVENMLRNSMVIGEPVMPGGWGEFETVACVGKYGHSMFTALGASNLSFTCQLPRPHLRQKMVPENLRLEDKVYLTFAVTDGDHLGLVKERLPRLYLDPTRGTLPLGWTLNPVLIDLAPNVIEWYYKNAINDVFMCGPNGTGYTYACMNLYFRDFLEHTREYMERVDMGYVMLLDHIVLGASPKTLREYAKVCDGIFSEYGWTWRDYEKSFEFVDDVLVVYSASFMVSREHTFEHIRKKTPRVRPAFVYVPLFPWRMNPSDAKWIANNLGDEYVVVRPDTFLHLLKQASGAPP